MKRNRPKACASGSEYPVLHIEIVRSSQTSSKSSLSLSTSSLVRVNGTMTPSYEAHWSSQSGNALCTSRQSAAQGLGPQSSPRAVILSSPASISEEYYVNNTEY